MRSRPAIILGLLAALTSTPAGAGEAETRFEIPSQRLALELALLEQDMSRPLLLGGSTLGLRRWRREARRIWPATELPLAPQLPFSTAEERLKRTMKRRHLRCSAELAPMSEELWELTLHGSCFPSPPPSANKPSVPPGPSELRLRGHPERPLRWYVKVADRRGELSSMDFAKAVDDPAAMRQLRFERQTAIPRIAAMGLTGLGLSVAGAVLVADTGMRIGDEAYPATENTAWSGVVMLTAGQLVLGAIPGAVVSQRQRQRRPAWFWHREDAQRIVDEHNQAVAGSAELTEEEGP